MVLGEPIQIVWTNLAKGQLNSIKTFLLDEWGQSAAKKFRGEVHRTIFAISITPFGFKKLSSNIETRVAVVVKQVSIIYKYDVRENRIVILQLWDNRMNPSKLNF